MVRPWELHESVLILGTKPQAGVLTHPGVPCLGRGSVYDHGHAVPSLVRRPQGPHTA